MAKINNLLFITSDQWRAECLSCLDHPTVKTPNLDALASEGVFFNNHFAQCTMCGPSRASIYTGMYLQNHRSVTNGSPLDSRHTNIALELRKLGYDPALIGYTDTSPDPRLYASKDPILTRRIPRQSRTTSCTTPTMFRSFGGHLRWKKRQASTPFWPFSLKET